MEFFLVNFLGVLAFGRCFNIWDFSLCVGNSPAPRLTPRNHWGFYLPAGEPRGGGGGVPSLCAVSAVCFASFQKLCKDFFLFIFYPIRHRRKLKAPHARPFGPRALRLRSKLHQSPLALGCRS